MYMALMSGGQMLQKKRMIARKMWIFSKNDDEEQQKQADKEAELATARAADGSVDKDDLEARPMPAQVTICPPGCEATYFPEKVRSFLLCSLYLLSLYPLSDLCLKGQTKARFQQSLRSF